MKLITLGTSHGAAEKDRFCSATLLDINGTLYLFDCGAPVEALLPRYGRSTADIKAIFITHMHEDHAGGLPAIYKKFDNYHKEKSCVMHLPEQAGIDGLIAWMGTLHAHKKIDNVELRLVTEGKFFVDENISVIARRTHHLGDAPSYSYIIEAEGKRLLLTGDMDSDFYDFEKISKGYRFDLILCEFTHYTDIEVACKNLSTADCDNMVLNHVQLGKYEMLPQYRHIFPYHVHIANDGDEFEI